MQANDILADIERSQQTVVVAELQQLSSVIRSERATGFALYLVPPAIADELRERGARNIVALSEETPASEAVLGILDECLHNGYPERWPERDHDLVRIRLS